MNRKPGKPGVRRARRREPRLGLLLFSLILIALLLVAAPLEPTRKAVNMNPDGTLTSAHAGSQRIWPRGEWNFPDWVA